MRSSLLRTSLFATVAAAVLAGCASDPISFPTRGSMEFGIKQLDVLKSRDPGIYSCSRLQATYDASDWPKGNSLDVVREIDRRVRKRFVYQSEPEGTDEWNSRAMTALTTLDPLTGDCDELAMTVLHLSLCAGVDPDRVGIVMTRTKSAEPVPLTVSRANHLTAFYMDRIGRAYSMGDTNGPVAPFRTWNQRIASWTFASDRGIWHFSRDGEVFKNAWVAAKAAAPAQQLSAE